jgi:hypothetical protein
MENRYRVRVGAAYLVTMAAILAAVLLWAGPLNPFGIADPAAQRIAALRAAGL